jgi:hypothetical protein
MESASPRDRLRESTATNRHGRNVSVTNTEHNRPASTTTPRPRYSSAPAPATRIRLTTQLGMLELLLVSQLALGVLVGAVGVVLATPLAAALMVMVQMLYVEDVLHDR